MKRTAAEIIAALRLERLPGEGGFFRQTACTDHFSAILFLLTASEFSAWHRIAQDELWHFHGGEPVDHFQIDPHGGVLRATRLGGDPLSGESPQVFVSAGTWQAARLGECARSPATLDRGRYALLGCTVTPPWQATGFELATRTELEREFPTHAQCIAALTR